MMIYSLHDEQVSDTNIELFPSRPNDLYNILIKTCKILSFSMVVLFEYLAFEKNDKLEILEET